MTDPLMCPHDDPKGLALTKLGEPRCPFCRYAARRAALPTPTPTAPRTDERVLTLSLDLPPNVVPLDPRARAAGAHRDH